MSPYGRDHHFSIGQKESAVCRNPEARRSLEQQNPAADEGNSHIAGLELVLTAEVKRCARRGGDPLGAEVLHNCSGGLSAVDDAGAFFPRIMAEYDEQNRRGRQQGYEDDGSNRRPVPASGYRALRGQLIRLMEEGAPQGTSHNGKVGEFGAALAAGEKNGAQSASVKLFSM